MVIKSRSWFAPVGFKSNWRGMKLPAHETRSSREYTLQTRDMSSTFDATQSKCASLLVENMSDTPNNNNTKQCKNNTILHNHNDNNNKIMTFHSSGLSSHNFNKRLVQIVEKHKLLYNGNEEGYNIKEQDEIWKKIAKELNEDVGALKLKWKNIRSCYTRYLRQISSPNASSLKNVKKYYLAKYLGFLLPYCKPRSYSDVRFSAAINDKDILGEQETSSQCDIVEKTEPLSEDEQEIDLECDQLYNSMMEEQNDETNKSYVNRKRDWEENSSHNLDCSSSKYSRFEQIQDDDPDMAFFRSLLPDFKSMNGKQKNTFKMAVLKAIDSILYSDNNY